MEKKLLISQSLLRLSKSKRKVMKHKTYLFHWRRGKKFASEHNGEGEVTIVTGFLASLHLSQNQCDSIEKATRAQRQCTEWVQKRKGRISASKYHEVHTKVKIMAGRKKVVKTKPLIARNVHHQSLNVSAMQWGQAHEKDALDALVKTEWTKHTNMHIFEVGLFAKKRTSLTLGQVLMLLAPVKHLLLNANVHTALKMRGFLTPGIKLSFYGWIVVEHVC